VPKPAPLPKPPPPGKPSVPLTPFPKGGVPLTPFPRPVPPVVKNVPKLPPKAPPRVAQLPRGGQMGRLTPFARGNVNVAPGGAAVKPVANRPALQLPRAIDNPIKDARPRTAPAMRGGGAQRAFGAAPAYGPAGGLAPGTHGNVGGTRPGAVAATGPVVPCDKPCPAGTCKIRAGALAPSAPRGSPEPQGPPPHFSPSDGRDNGNDNQPPTPPNWKDNSFQNEMLLRQHPELQAADNAETAEGGVEVEAAAGGGYCRCVQMQGPCPDGSNNNRNDDGGKGSANYSKKKGGDSGENRGADNSEGNNSGKGKKESSKLADPFASEQSKDPRFNELAKDPQTGQQNPKAGREAATILQAEKEGIIKDPQRPVLKNGEPNLDFKTTDPKTGRRIWTDAKNPVPNNMRSIETQAKDVARTIKGYGKNVRVIIDLKDVPPAEKGSFMDTLKASGADISNVYYLNR